MLLCRIPRHTRSMNPALQFSATSFSICLFCVVMFPATTIFLLPDNSMVALRMSPANAAPMGMNLVGGDDALTGGAASATRIRVPGIGSETHRGPRRQCIPAHFDVDLAESWDLAVFG